MDSNLLNLIGLCKKAGRLEVGEEPVGGACRAKQCRLLLVAADAAENTVRRSAHFAEAGNCIRLRLPFSRDELGGAVGRTSCALLAVTDIGFASAIAKRLAAENPALYADAAERLDVKAQRAMERRQEQLRHEKNLRQGKHRVRSSAPPAEPPAPPAPSKKADRPPVKSSPRRPGGSGASGGKNRFEKNSGDKSGRPNEKKGAPSYKKPYSGKEGARPSRSSGKPSGHYKKGPKS